MRIQDTTHHIAKGAKRFFSGTMLSRLSGLAREVLMASVFGVNAATAAFWMAFRFASLLRRILGEGALNSAFVPHYESLKNQDSQKAARFFYDLVMGSSWVLFVLIVLGEALMGASLFYMRLSIDTQEIVRLTMLLFPSIAFISLFALNSSLLNCQGSFLLPSAAPSILNVIWIGAIFCVARLPVNQALEKLCIFLVAGFAVQWLVTLIKIVPYLSAVSRSRTEKTAIFAKKEILALMRPFALGILGVTATQINSALDAVFARIADAQGPAYLWYALRLQQLPLAVIGVGLTSALLPSIARAVEQKNQQRYLHFLNFSLNQALLWLLPIMGAIFVLGLSSVNLIYGHGQFSLSAVVETTRCLWAYGLALLPMTLVLILASAFYAHKNYRIPTQLSLLSIGLNVMLNALFVFGFHWGAVSIALATAISSCANALLLIFCLKKQSMFKIREMGKLALRIVTLMSVSVFICVLFNQIAFGNNPLAPLGGATIHVPSSLLEQLKIFFRELCLFIVVSVVVGWLFGMKKLFKSHPRALTVDDVTGEDN